MQLSAGNISSCQLTTRQDPYQAADAGHSTGPSTPVATEKLHSLCISPPEGPQESQAVHTAAPCKLFCCPLTKVGHTIMRIHSDSSYAVKHLPCSKDSKHGSQRSSCCVHCAFHLFVKFSAVQSAVHPYEYDRVALLCSSVSMLNRMRMLCREKCETLCWQQMAIHMNERQ